MNMKVRPGLGPVGSAHCGRARVSLGTLSSQPPSATLQPPFARPCPQLKAGELSVVISSDAAARGVDVPHLSAVVQYDAPAHVKTYVHRVGRTARAGTSGVSYTLLRPQQVCTRAVVGCVCGVCVWVCVCVGGACVYGVFVGACDCVGVGCGVCVGACRCAPAWGVGCWVLVCSGCGVCGVCVGASRSAPVRGGCLWVWDVWGLECVGCAGAWWCAPALARGARSLRVWGV
jgi:hypothetical protein